MRIKLNATPEQVALIRAMGSSNKITSMEASEAFASTLGTVVQKVLFQASTAGLIYTDLPYLEDDSPSWPLDLQYDQDAGYITTWSQQIAGGLPTSQVEGVKEMKFSTYTIDSAVSFLKKYARKSNMPVISKAVERMTNEVLIKQERNAYAVATKAAAEASTKNGRASNASGALQHVIRVGTAGSFFPNDLSNLIIRSKRINVAYSGGTPTVGARGVTDLIISPEIKGLVRGFAYNAVNNTGSISTGPVPVPNSVREAIWDAAGAQEIFGINLHEMVEFGTSQTYNTLFGTFAGSTSYAKIDGTSGATFSGSTQQILLGIDLTRDGLVRPVQTDNGGGQVQVFPDDQFTVRSDKAGFYLKLEEGRACIDSRAIMGLIV